ncbi:DNA-directed RNA polymerase subunit L [Candidatus Bathyarchaeota archaeon]|nr:DNA-directed RNA polymerase subunit L [Candidatus Bathyarchaeota archaeon]
MEIKVLKKTDNELKIEVEGIGHTICNLLQSQLLKDERVDAAGYDIPHPLASNPIIFIRTNGKASPKEVLLDAIARAREANRDFGDKLREVLKA